MKRSSKPTIAGILDLVVGGLMLIVGLVFLVSGIVVGINVEGNLFPVLGILILPPGALAVTGGIYALRRRHWLVALICSILGCAFWVLSIPAIILIALSKEEFGQTPRTA
jgi:protein-S-isoprenylcysteine O-methyltransferase Ste14